MQHATLTREAGLVGDHGDDGEPGVPGRHLLQVGEIVEAVGVAPQAPQVLAEGIGVLDVGDDPAQRVHQPVALGSHRNREQIPRLRVPQEQV